MLKILIKGLFPTLCLICRQEGSWLCAGHDRLPAAPKNQVVYQYVDQVFAATAYQHPSNQALVEYLKFRGFRQLAPLMAQTIKQRTPSALWQYPIVPIPLHWQRKLWRGFNQSQLIAASLGPTHPSLKRIKATKQQARLDLKARSQNLKSAFVWISADTPQTIILLDDVVASGHTLEAAAKACKDAGVKQVIVVTFARGGT